MYLSAPLTDGWYVVINAYKFTVFERFFEDILLVRAIPTYRSTNFMIEEESDGEQLWEECEGQNYDKAEFDVEPATNTPPLPKSTTVNNCSQRAQLGFVVSRIPDSASSKALHL